MTGQGQKGTASSTPTGSSPVRLEQSLLDLIDAEALPKEFAEWCAKVGLTSVRKFGMRVESASECQSVFVDACNGMFQNAIKADGDVSAVKLVWQCVFCTLACTSSCLLYSRLGSSIIFLLSML